MKYFTITIIFIISEIISTSQIYSDFNFYKTLSVTGKVVNRIAPIISINRTTNDCTVSVSFILKDKTNEPAIWHKINGILPGQIALFDSKGNCIKSKNTNILSVYQNDRYCDIFEIPPFIRNKYERKLYKDIIGFRYNKLINHICDINLNNWYDIDYNNKYTLLLRPWLYEPDYLTGKAELIMFNRLK